MKIVSILLPEFFLPRCELFVDEHFGWDIVEVFKGKMLHSIVRY